ncbi:MAG: RsmB/NOP family class I SAM-dependent RNA methyltransferase [Mucilaginibacter sp.]|uniref:RsmB/NOP family class I SAM-dependent RNA methyltransferase n=1 Tax=Mucilaginibacter sp. TaxID=1882438 RepID=UPI00326625F8
MKAFNQLKTFQRILGEYPVDTPLSKFLPGFYRQNKQMGSSDRRVASRLIYNYFRLGKALDNIATEERLYVAEFLCNTQSNSFLDHFKPDWALKVGVTLDEKLEIIKVAYPEFRLEDVFPWTDQLSPDIDKTAFLKSFFIQPDLYIRVLKGYETQVKSVLTQAGITFKEEGNQCISLPNGTRLDTLFQSLHWFEIQDYSSQQTAQFFKPHKWDHWWDACAASGGKSLLLHELEPDLKLVVSDIRESILANLDERFQQAGLRKYQRKVVDLTKNVDPELHDYEFDGIILDAPCSGSGTWSRTPEMISQFQDFKIQSFKNLQQSIVRNVIKYIKSGKPLIYITCSAFKAENEDMVEFLTSEFGFKLEETQVLKGYGHKADTMFVARMSVKDTNLTKPAKEE